MKILINEHLLSILCIAGGGALGALSRWLISCLFVLFLPAFPYVGIMVMNGIGCFLIGGIFGYLIVHEIPGAAKEFMITGFLGSLTTFSTYSLYTVSLWKNARYIHAFVNAAGTLIIGIAAVIIGMATVRFFMR